MRVKYKYAFTMMEVIFVIVVIGIIAAVVVPRFDGTADLRNAALQLVNDIRYTQHLAMNDDHIATNDTNWFKKRWTIIFNSDANTDYEEAYTIFADITGGSTGNPDEAEVAINPLDRSRRLSGGYTGKTMFDIKDLETNPSNFKGTKQNNLGKTYGIASITLSSSCRLGTSKRISFDHLGRPLKGDLSSYTSPYPSTSRLLTSTCQITLIDRDNQSITIYIEPETGYVHL